MDEATNPTIWEALDSWSGGLEPWQRYVVSTAASQGKLSPEQIEEAYKLFLIDKKLLELTDGDTAPTIPPLLGRPKEALTDKLVLNKVGDMKGINALPENSEMVFGDGLTIVFGENGVGKTGFFRLLSNACFSREQPKLLDNIYSEVENEQKASFHISVGGVDQVPIEFPVEEDVSPLKRITVFDTSVALHHLTQNAAFAFKPVGFDVFPEIGRVYQILESKLNSDIRDRQRSNDFPRSFAGAGGEVYEAVVSLGAATDMDVLRALASYGKTESDRIEAIEIEIAKLRTQKSKESLDDLRQAKSDVDILSAQVGALEETFGDEPLKRRHSLIAKAKETAAAASALGSDSFKRPFFKAVGTSEWEAFVQTAHALAKKEGGNYPEAKSHCLLCERELDKDSQQHIQELLAFVEGDARRAAAIAQSAVDAELHGLERTDFNVFPKTARVRSHVHRYENLIEEEIDKATVAIIGARDHMIVDLRDLETKASPLVRSNVEAELKGLSERIAADIAKLESDKSDKEIDTLELEKRVLRHRLVLSQILPQIEEYVSDAKWAAKAAAARPGLNTRPITDKETRLSEEILTDGYRARLAEECKKLNCDLPVELRTSGQRGQTLHNLMMPGGYRPNEVLSEGEQKAVAIADFLTEVALNPAAAGIVLDDPVSTLDDKRKDSIAKRLVEESRERQVIVFTHDMVFLTQLSNATKDAGIEFVGHWVEHDAEGKPGQVAPNDLPTTSNTYQTTQRAEEALAKAKNLTGTDRESELRRGMACLRTTLEETVVRRVFRDIVPRWSNRVIMTKLKKVNWDNAKVDEIVDLFEELSAYMEGHSRTDEARGVVLEPKHLEEKIAAVQAIIKWAKAERD